MLTAGLRGDGRIVAEAVWGGATGEDNHGDAAGQWHRTGPGGGRPWGRGPGDTSLTDNFLDSYF